MTPDQLLNRMLSFANSHECTLHRKRDVERGAWEICAKSLDEFNPFAYDKVKHEKIHYIEGYSILNKPVYYSVRKYKRMTAADWIQRRKDAQYKIQLQKEAKKQAEKKEAKIRTNESKKKPVIDLDTKKVYSSCTDAAKANNIHIGTLSNYLLNKKKVRPQINNFQYLEDYQNNEFNKIEKKEQKKFITRLNNFPRFNSKQIIDLDTKKIYESLSILSTQINVPVSSVSKYLITKDRKWLVKRVRETLNIMYYTDYQLLNNSNEKANQ